MKIKTEDFVSLQAIIAFKIAQLGDLEPYKERYKKNSGGWEKRLRWDILYSVPFAERNELITRIYKYADDTHIDTALKKIMKGYM